MLGALNQLIVRVSASGWLFLLTAILAFGSLGIMMRIGAAFSGITGGVPPFDLQNGLTSAQVIEQLPHYTGEARQLYLQFTAIDYLFPFAAGLFLAAIAAFCLRRAFPGAYAMINGRELLPLLMLATLFDWCENIAALASILTYPDTSTALATALVVAKRLKLTMVFSTQGLVVLLLSATVVLLMRRLRPG